MTITESVKVTNLAKVNEYLIHKEPELLDLYLDETLQFSLDRSAEVRKMIAGFIEEAGYLISLLPLKIFKFKFKSLILFNSSSSSKQPDVIPRLVQTLSRLVRDDASAVSKRSLRAAGRILKATLKWISSAPIITTDMELAWTQLSNLKVEIINMIDSDNDG